MQMRFQIVDSVSVPGDLARENEDAFAADPAAAAVLDGATPICDPLLPVRSDAAWIARSGAERLVIWATSGASAKVALMRTLVDIRRDFVQLRRRAPKERFELPLASMVFAVPIPDGFDVLWFGDCMALVLRPGSTCEAIGTALDLRKSETAMVQCLVRDQAVTPVGAPGRVEFLRHFQFERDQVNMAGGRWLFGVEPDAAEHVKSVRVTAPPGTYILLCTDGFLAAVSEYKLYSADQLMYSVIHRGLRALTDEIRAVEEADPQGRRFPRFKKSDDATALLVRTASA